MATRVANRIKVECLHGHRLDGPNLKIKAHGWRACRSCDLSHSFRRNQLVRRGYVVSEAERVAYADERYAAITNGG